MATCETSRGRYLSRRDNRRSAKGLPPVWQVGQYCRLESANDTSRTVSPHTGHGRPVRPCTARLVFFSDFNSFAARPRDRSAASLSTDRIASYSVELSASLRLPAGLKG